MATKKYLPVPIHFYAGTSGLVRRSEVVCLCGVHPDLVDRLGSLGLVEPVGRDAYDSEPLFRRETVPLIEKILRLRKELGINYVGVGVVLELLSRIEKLEKRIRELESRRSWEAPASSS
jgi:MerR family transcriptional regulator/heat shock protein HspR